MNDMTLTRRSFFNGALALAAATQLPSRAFATAPTIHGDGLHDDTAGLQAAFDGKPFRVVGEGAFVVNRNGGVYLMGGTFKLSDTLIIRGLAHITGSHFDGRAIPANRGSIIRIESRTERAMRLESGQSAGVAFKS